MSKVKKLIPKEVIYTAPDDKKKRVELSADFMPVTKSMLEKYGPDDLQNVREGMIKTDRVRLAELHVTNVEAAFIEAEIQCENPVFYYGMSSIYVMIVTNFKTTGSNILVSGKIPAKK